MIHFAFMSPPYAGHLNPMLALARGLVDRGHRVTVLGQPDMAALVDRPGVGFAAVGPASHPPGTLATMTRHMGATSGLFGMRAVLSDLVRTTAMLCKEAPAVLHAIGAQAIVADQTEAAGGLVARHLGLPQISLANALLINREPLLPPPFVDWRYDDTAWGLKRNRGGYRVADLLMRSLADLLRRQAAAWSLGPIASLEDCLSPLLQISQAVEGFDFPRREAPANLIQVGPLREAETARCPAWDDRPLVFCSLGTLQGARAPMFRIAAEAAAALDHSLLIAHGGKLDPHRARGWPGPPRLEAFVPQRAVMQRAAAVVTHGGLNTVLDALAAGVPMVVLPIAFEQGAIGARIERCGAGVVIRPRRLTAVGLAEALTRLRQDPAYKRNAQALKAEIAAAGGVARAVDAIETVLASGKDLPRRRS